MNPQNPFILHLSEVLPHFPNSRIVPSFCTALGSEWVCKSSSNGAFVCSFQSFATQFLVHSWSSDYHFGAPLSNLGLANRRWLISTAVIYTISPTEMPSIIFGLLTSIL
jgi:hypothetical protein